MTTDRLKEVMQIPGLNLPERSEYVAWAELVELTAIEPARWLNWSISVGSTDRTCAKDYLFRLRDVYRIHKLMRLVKDLDVSFSSGSIIVDLLERVEELETEIEELKRLV